MAGVRSSKLGAARLLFPSTSFGPPASVTTDAHLPASADPDNVMKADQMVAHLDVP